LFKGIYTPIVTPFKANEEFDPDKMKYNLNRWGSTRLDGIVVLGSNGEFCYLSEKEKLEITSFVLENFTTEKKVIVGTSCESTRETITLTKKVAEMGAHAVLVLPSNYYKGAMKDDVLYKFFMDIADESPIPVMLYNMPANTGINLLPALIAKLAKHKNIVGIKDTSGNIVQLTEIIRDTDDEFAVFAGNAGYLLPALAVGARGATLALANILPDECCELVSLFYEGKLKEARELQLKLIEPNFAVTSGGGISALKAAMDMLGYKGGFPRRPLKPLADDSINTLKTILEKAGVTLES
jgi:4-hydroxy-2-oxoglutarate aldolase